MNVLYYSESLALVLLDAAAKGTLLLAAAFLIALVLRRASAAVRHRLWGLAMGGLVLLPALSWMLPAWRLPILPASSSESTSARIAVRAEPELPFSTQRHKSESPNEAIIASAAMTATDFDPPPAESTRPLPPSTVEPSTSPRNDGPSRAKWAAACAVIVWSMGSGLLLAGVAIGIHRTGRLWRGSQSITDESWGQLARELSMRLGLRRRVGLREHEDPVIPLTWGLLRPIVLLPRQARLWSDTMRRAVLLHELAHVHRGDVAYQLLGRVACALYWFHPLAWFGLHQLRKEREQACDDAVVGSGERASDYAAQLLEVARHCRRAGGLALAVEITRGGSLEQRVRALFDAARSHAPVGRRMAVALLVVAGLMASAIAVLRPVAIESQSAAAESASVAAEDEHSGQATAAETQDRQKAAELVRALYASEAWIDSVDSILIRTQLEQTRVERPDDYSRTIVWAWDKSRIRHEVQIRETKDAPVSGWRTKIWDGALALSQTKDAPGEIDRQYVLGAKAGAFFDTLGTLINEWEIAGIHHFWWSPIDIDRSRSTLGLLPEDFEFAGEEDVNGRPCHVVQSRTGHWRFHIGVADGRLYRRTRLAVGSDSPGYDRLALYRRIGGEAIKTVHHWEPWLESLQREEQRRARRALAAAEFELARPEMRATFADYREVSPGCWFPFTRIRDFYEFSKLPDVNDVVAVVRSRLDETVTEITVNQALPDELFQMQLTDGVKTQDQRYDPPIDYTYRKDQTEAERLALCEIERRRVAERTDDIEQRLASVKSRVGAAPPPLPKDGWIAGGPLTWEGLRGKVVVLHFCNLERTNYQRACQTELPIMQSWHERSNKSGVVVIGVHRPTNDVAAVKKMLVECGATYPVVIDALDDKADGLGQMHDWFETHWWPSAVIIDQHGVVAGYGQLWHGEIVDRNGIYYVGDKPWMPGIAPQIDKLLAKEGAAKPAEAKQSGSAAVAESPASKKAAAEKKPNDDETIESRVSTHPVTIAGVARNAKGQPIANATVYLLSTLYENSRRVAETMTDARGQYEFRDAPLPVARPERNAGGRVHGAFEILGVADGYGFAWRPSKSFMAVPRPAPGEDNFISQPTVDDPTRFFQDDAIELDLEFPAAASIKGRIVDEQNRPVAGVKLDLRFCERIHDEIDRGVLSSARIYELTALNQPEDFPAAVKSRKTDADGRFAFTGLPPECLFKFDVRHPDYARKDVWAATTTDELPKLGRRKPILTGELELIFQAVRDAKVRVVYADTGEPAPGVYVGAEGDGTIAWQTSNAKGEVTLRLPKGEYPVHLLPATGTPYLLTKPDEMLTVKAEPAGDPTVFELRRACMLDVTIVDADTGEPIPDVDLWIDARENPDEAGTAAMCTDFYFRSWDPPTARVERPVSDKNGKLRALVEPGLRRLGPVYQKHPAGYAPDGVGQLFDCEAGQTLKVEFQLHKYIIAAIDPAKAPSKAAATTGQATENVDHLKRFNRNLARARRLVAAAKPQAAVPLLEEAIRDLMQVPDEELLTEVYRRFGTGTVRIRSTNQEQLIECLLSAGQLDTAKKLANEIQSSGIQADAFAKIAEKLGALGQRDSANRYLDLALAAALREKEIPQEFARFWGYQEATWRLVALEAVADACDLLGEVARFDEIVSQIQKVRGDKGDAIEILLRTAHRQLDRQDDRGLQQTLVRAAGACANAEAAKDVIAGFWNDACNGWIESDKFDEVVSHLDKLDGNARERMLAKLVRGFSRNNEIERAESELKRIGAPDARATAMIFLARAEAAAGTKDAAAKRRNDAVALLRDETNPFSKVEPLLLAVETLALWGDSAAAEREAEQIIATVRSDTYSYSLFGGPRSDYYEMPFQIVVGPATSWLLIARAQLGAGKIDEALKTIERLNGTEGLHALWVEVYRVYFYGNVARELLRRGQSERVRELLSKESNAAVREALETELLPADAG